MMKNFKSRLITASVLGFVSASILAQVARSYNYLPPDRFGGGTAWVPPTVQYYFDAAFPANYQGLANQGAQVWTDTPSSFQFVKVNTPNFSLQNQGGVLWITLDGSSITSGSSAIDSQRFNVLGQASFLKFTDDPVGPSRFKIEMDKDEPWYVGSGAISDAQIDLQGVLAHEFGHVVALDHTQGNRCRVASTSPTMCAVFRLGLDGIPYRFLEADDIQGISAKYP